jgi:hypothetical protein
MKLRYYALLIIALALPAFHSDLCAQTPAPSTPAPVTPIPLATPGPTPAPPLNLSAKLPPATVTAAFAALAPFVALPQGIAPTQIRVIQITLLPDGSAVVNVR